MGIVHIAYVLCGSYGISYLEGVIRECRHASSWVVAGSLMVIRHRHVVTYCSGFSALPLRCLAVCREHASRSGRAVKAATRFGDKGELEGAARSFPPTPVQSKPIVSLAVESSVPGFCLPGNFVWATGLLGGVKQHLGFKASVVKLRTRYPRIHVRYLADRAGNTAWINLPEMREAYLMADAIAEYDGE